jgi:hypothetical protein
MGAPANPSLTLFIVPGTFCALQFTIYFLLLPAIAARCIGVRYAEMFLPLWRPVFATVLCSPVLVFVPRWLAEDPANPGPAVLAATALAYGVLYLLLAIGLVLTGPERERFVWGPLRQLAARRKPTAPLEKTGI